MTCRTCQGSGHILSSGTPLEWWPCPACGGAGVRIMYGPAVLKVKTKLVARSTTQMEKRT